MLVAAIIGSSALTLLLFKAWKRCTRKKSMRMVLDKTGTYTEQYSDDRSVNLADAMSQSPLRNSPNRFNLSIPKNHAHMNS